MKRSTKSPVLNKKLVVQTQQQEHPDLNALKAVRVDWIDSTAQGGWGDYMETDMRCCSIGILIHKDKDVVVLAQNWSNSYLGEYITIPMVAVKKVKVLK